jgi:hypothetical protein
LRISFVIGMSQKVFAFSRVRVQAPNSKVLAAFSPLRSRKLTAAA